MNYWDQLRNYLQKKVSSQEYENWLRGASFAGMENGTLSVAVPDRETRTWMEREYTPLIREGIQELLLPVRAIAYQVEAPRGPQNQAMAAITESPVETDGPSTLL